MAECMLFVVGDDELAGQSISNFAGGRGIPARRFSSAAEFLEFYDAFRPSGCLVADLRQPEMNGFDLQAELQRRRAHLSMVFLTSVANTPATVRAMKRGAVSIIDKSAHFGELWEAVREGLDLADEQQARRQRARELRSRLDLLSEPERSVLELIVQGLPNKAIASRIGVSLRTVENRRREVFRKLQAQSVAELARLVLELRALETGAAGCSC